MPKCSAVSATGRKVVVRWHGHHEHRFNWAATEGAKRVLHHLNRSTSKRASFDVSLGENGEVTMRQRGFLGLWKSKPRKLEPGEGFDWGLLRFWNLERLSRTHF